MDSPWSPAWSLKSLTSRSVKVYPPKPSVDVWEPTRAATVVRSSIATATTMSTPVIAVEETEMTVDMRIARRSTPTSVDRPLCLQFLLLVCLVASHSQCQHLPMVCRCSLLDSPSLDKPLRKHHLNHLHQDIALEAQYPKR